MATLLLGGAGRHRPARSRGRARRTNGRCSGATRRARARPRRPDDGPGIRWRFDAGAALTGSAVSIVGDLVYTSSDRRRPACPRRHDGCGAVAVRTRLPRVPADGRGRVGLCLHRQERPRGARCGQRRRRMDGCGRRAWTTRRPPAMARSTLGQRMATSSPSTSRPHEERWRTDVSASGPVHAPAFSDGRVFVSSDGGPFVGVEAADGSIAWRHDTGLRDRHRGRRRWHRLHRRGRERLRRATLGARCRDR